MTDVLRQLIRASWRQIEFPLSGREYGFQQSSSRHKFIFRDNELIESLGRENPTYKYTIPFREDIAKGPYSALFVEVYPEFLNACRDRTAGILEDPVHGPQRCKCASLREVLDVNRRDGIDVEAEFIFSPLQSDVTEDISIPGSIEGALNSAGAFDRQAPELTPEQRERIEALRDPGEQAGTNILDLGSAFATQINLATNRIGAQIDDAIFRVNKTSDLLDRARDPKLASWKRRLRRVGGALLNLKDSAGGAGLGPSRGGNGLRTHIVQADIGIGSLASKLGASVSQLKRLNPSLNSAITVSKGTAVRYVESA